MDIASLILGVSDQMGGNLSQLGSDVLEKRQTDNARAWDLTMWNLQNAYNDPSQQMARFKNAGLNPNLIYGKGTPGLAESPKSAVKSNASGKMDFDSLQTYMAAKQAEIIPYQVELTKQQIKNETVKEKILNEELTGREITNYINDWSKDYQAIEKIKDSQLKEIDYQNKLLERHEGIPIAQARLKTEIMELQKQLLSGQISMNTYEIELNKKGLSKKDPAVFRIFKMVMDELLTK